MYYYKTHEKIHVCVHVRALRGSFHTCSLARIRIRKGWHWRHCALLNSTVVCCTFRGWGVLCGCAFGWGHDLVGQLCTACVALAGGLWLPSSVSVPKCGMRVIIEWDSPGNGVSWFPGSRFVIVCSACARMVFIVPFLNLVDTAHDLLGFSRFMGACTFLDLLWRFFNSHSSFPVRRLRLHVRSVWWGLVTNVGRVRRWSGRYSDWYALFQSLPGVKFAFYHFISIPVTSDRSSFALLRIFLSYFRRLFSYSKGGGLFPYYSASYDCQESRGQMSSVCICVSSHSHVRCASWWVWPIRSLSAPLIPHYGAVSGTGRLIVLVYWSILVEKFNCKW